LEKHEGVIRVIVNFNTKKAFITIKEGNVKSEELKVIIESAGEFTAAEDEKNK